MEEIFSFKDLAVKKYSGEVQESIAWLCNPVKVFSRPMRGPGFLEIHPSIWKKGGVFYCGVIFSGSSEAAVFTGLGFNSEEESILDVHMLADVYRKHLFSLIDFSGGE
ncbi:hypothetical protein [Rhodobacter viridis]|uniref:hypothetical protein n=1 Tax=Rhodobacter viridis TaxID=1054202 RepID=UPI0011B76169|nr:hypothetical protein [Rhodobacter viridis]